ncbi:MAG: AMP-dependent synthetase/ligase [Candidatus Nanopelagicales bacterium]
MQEYAEPPVLPDITNGNLTDRLLESEKTAADTPAVSLPDGDGWRNLSCAEFAAEVRAVARGLMASGVQFGDRVGIMSRTRYEWTLVDFALAYAGAVSVPIYETSSAEQVAWILSDSGAVGVFLELDRHEALFDQVRADLPDVTRTWVFEAGSLDDLAASGAAITDEQLEERRCQASPDDVATIIYTSGTTGRPKGCVLTHRNLIFAGDIVMASAPELFVPGQSSLLFLPLAHSFGRQIGIACIRGRIQLGHTPDAGDLLHDLGTFAPTFVLAVPRVFEKVYNGAQAKATAEGRGRIFDAASQVAIDYSRALDSAGPGLFLRAKHFLFDKLVYAKLRAAMGGNVEYAVSGGAPLGERLGHYFRGIGITILEGYGLTENMAGTTMNRPDTLKIGTVGKPFPGTAVRIADDGEVLLKGPHVFRGYWNNPQATAEALEPDGWFHTGDIGQLDDEGFLRITGRKKELIVTAGGKNVAPAVLEDRLRAHSLVSQCMVVGDAKPFIACLVTLDEESLPGWLAQKGRPGSTSVADLVTDPQLVAEIQSAVDDANKAVSKAESIRKFKILPQDWTEAAGQITPSLKLKRDTVMAEFADEVESLYT